MAAALANTNLAAANQAAAQQDVNRKQVFEPEVAAASHTQPQYHGIPTTSFTCVEPYTENNKVPGFYADPEAGCQVTITRCHVSTCF